ncbi:hypothetical protein B0T10DRAFT_400019 [Thelonectria olida]|uniref:Fungal-type protein kinase domain-containing protein n=1 Tax=Thelonectria olida TaxID=1576542 RepID=A0A9P9AP27_9HYPO|nr:hypothetical protein B0T10DRAFT_400019 [Thelonectria olida]
MTQAELDRNILDEIDGHVHSVVQGFFEKYFVNKPWTPSLFSTCAGGRSIFRSHVPGNYRDCVPQGTSQRFLVSAEYIREGDYDWAEVQVVGQFQVNPDYGYVPGFLHLCRCAREVFRSQPTRLFLHGFYVIGSKMELWMFDRSGLYGSEPFDVRDDLERLITIVSGYSRMSDTELGINPLILLDDAGKYILAEVGDGPEVCKFYLEGEPIAFPQTIVSQGSTCYRARLPASTKSEFVLKLSWRSGVRSPEEKMLRLAKDRKVWGAVQLISHQPIKNTCDGGFTTSRIDATCPRLERAGSMRETTLMDLTLSFLIVSPLGRPLDKFHTILEFLEGCRDAIKGHHSLYVDGKILHQDVSSGNIIIPDVKKNGEPRGVLIDLDLGMELAVGPARPDELIGTKAFMAIDLLAGKPHTYRHDLESFLYVFLWIVICGGHKQLPPKSRLQRWQVGNWVDLARKKTEDMADKNFATIISELAPEFKSLDSLAYQLREVLFLPLQDGSLFTGTKTGADEFERLYVRIIGVFDAAIVSYLAENVQGGKT